MNLYILTILLAAVVIIECKHTFVGSNVQRPMVYHHHAKYSSKALRKRVEYLIYYLPSIPSNVARSIQGIMVYDLSHSDATATVAQGGIGFNYVNLRLKSERGKEIDFDVYIYA